MSPNTVDAITAAWNTISVDQQRQLIFQYLKQRSGGKATNWMGFLADHFDLQDFGES